MLETVWADEYKSLAYFMVMYKKTFWVRLALIQEKVFCNVILRDPRVMYLRLIPDDVIRKEDIYLFKILILAAKEAVTRS